MDINEIKSVMEMRTPLEILAVKLVVDRITAQEIGKLENILSNPKELDSKDENNYRQLLLRESSFHNEIYKATRNDLLNETLHQIQTISIRFWMYVTNGGEDIYPHFDDLRELLEAIKKKDRSSAIKIMGTHITRTHDMLKHHI
jgi:DNA-binding GntR family transcriptional regulator